jgi:predicted MPP superfamily phosphohydrolase
MKKAIYIIIFLLLIVVSYFITASVYPRYTIYFPVFGLILLLDLYLWFSLKSRIFNLSPVFSYTLTILYWLPFFALLIMSVISVFYHFRFWDPAIYTYLTGVILITYLSKIFSAIFFFIADIVVVIRFAVKYLKQKKPSNGQTANGQRKKITRARFIQNIGLFSGGIILSGLAIGMVKWAHDFRLKNIYINLPVLPRCFDGLKIVQISDLHLGSWSSYHTLEEVIREVNGLGPDMVFFTGDLVNFTTGEAGRYEELLGKIKAKRGIYAILGNHDYGDYVNWDSPEAKEQNFDDLVELYKRIGWRLLRNESEILGSQGEQIAIIGVENWSAITRFPGYGDLEKAINGTQDIPVKILLSHDPTHWDEEVTKKFKDIDLTLSGHTHGFQFGVELKDFRWSPAQYMYKHWAGLYSVTNSYKPQYLYVNRGLGNIGYPGRVGILPEITLITVTSRK